MKIAKSVLAVVMVLAMIAGLSAMAFAAGTTFEVVAGEVKDNVVTVDIYAINAVGLASGDLVVKYDPAVLKVKGAVTKGDVFGYYGALDEEAMFAANTKNAEEGILIGFGFTGILDTKADFATKAEEYELTGATYDPAKVLLCSIKFTVADGATGTTDVVLSGSVKDGDGAAMDAAGKATITFGKEEPAKEEPSKVEPKPADDNEETTKAANPGTGDKTTGDNMALAAAGAVVVLAGAAFVISKKRK